MDGHRKMTSQEFFVLIGIMLILNLYSAFPLPALFAVGASHYIGFDFLGLPRLGRFMSLSRYKRLLRYIEFTIRPTREEETTTVFWKIQPLIDAFNENRKDGFVASYKLLTATSENIPLRAVSWNEGKKDRQTGRIIHKNIIATCGTTNNAPPHKKKRWTNREDGSTEYYHVNVKRPEIVREYFGSAQKIDVHNHLRQGSLNLEQRPTSRWEWRFFQTFLGIIVVDAFISYRTFYPNQEKANCSHFDFILDLVASLLDNKVDLPDSARVLRPRPGTDVDDESTADPAVHDMMSLKSSAYFTALVDREKRLAQQANRQPRRIQTALRCRVCGKHCFAYCATCTSNPKAAQAIVALCGVSTGRPCFVTHQQQLLSPMSSPAGSQPVSLPLVAASRRGRPKKRSR
jgi:hypothetical protein